MAAHQKNSNINNLNKPGWRTIIARLRNRLTHREHEDKTKEGEWQTPEERQRGSGESKQAGARN